MNTAKEKFDYITPYNPAPVIPEGIGPAWDAIGERSKQQSMPGQRTDPYRVAIAGEGGSLRSSMSSRMLEELLLRGIYNEIDDVYGSSAFVLIGAYYIARQSHLGTRIYHEDLCTRKFVSQRRALGSLVRRNPIMSLDYLFYAVDNIKPVNWQAVLESPIKLHPLITSLETGELVDLSDYETEEELKLRVKAACVLPVIAGQPIEVAGHKAIDAGLLQSFPYQKAIEDGSTHVVALKTRPQGNIPNDGMGRIGPILKHIFRVDSRILELAERRPEIYRRHDADLRLHISEGRAPYVSVVEPLVTDFSVDRLSRNPDEIKLAIEVGRLAVDRVLGPVEQEA